MSLVVKLEDDLGERSDWIMLHGVIPARDEKNFPFLRCIDLYGKTVLSGGSRLIFEICGQLERRVAHFDSTPRVCRNMTSNELPFPFFSTEAKARSAAAR